MPGLLVDTYRDYQIYFLECALNYSAIRIVSPAGEELEIMVSEVPPMRDICGALDEACELSLAVAEAFGYFEWE